jgi:TolB-like protein/DNA-binding winged helix-turn-helix (wHTH) protein/tetratricopeptide (TPR) repeat protein
LDGTDQGYGIFQFGPFRLDPVTRTLLRHGVRLHLPARLFDTLLYLVQHHDRLVEREELSRAVWSTHSVADGNLGRAISSLRLALKSVGEENLIITAPGRGYRFGLPVQMVRVEDAHPAPAAHTHPAPAAHTHSAPAARAGATARRGLGARSVAAIAAGLAVVGALAAVMLWKAPPPGASASDFAPPPHSIAVLPLTNRSSDAADTLYGDGIAQELINALSRIGGMKVAASTSAFLFRNNRATVGDIARQLNVGAVLEGSVQRTGPRLHVTVELIDARSGYQIWSHAYDQGQSDMLAMQGQIAAAVVTSLRGVILGNEAAQLTLGGTSSPAAFDAYLKGVTELHALDADANRRAVAAFNQAIAIDPDYALAFAHRARALAFIGTFGNSSDVDYSHRVMAAALQDAQHAVDLAPELGAAHADLAFVLQAGLTDLGRAETEYRRAIALAPGDATVLMNYGRFQLEAGRVQEGIDAAQEAAALDPLAAGTYGNLAIILEYARRYDEARLALHREEMLRPGNAAFSRVTLGMIETLQGHGAAAQRVCGGDVDYRDMMCLAIAYHMLGRQREAAAELAKTRAVLGDNGAFIYARIYAQWGDTAAALQWLQTAYRLRDPGLLELQVDPALDPIRSIAQYQDLVRSLGFPQP